MNVSSKFFGVLVLLSWIGLLMIEPISNKIDDLTTKQPWFDAELRLFDDGGVLKVEYTRWINRNMNAKPWRGWLEYPNRYGIWGKECSGSGNDSYEPSKTGTVVHTVDYFTGSNKPCLLHHKIMRVCANWDMYDQNNRYKYFGVICSPVYKNLK